MACGCHMDNYGCRYRGGSCWAEAHEVKANRQNHSIRWRARANVLPVANQSGRISGITYHYIQIQSDWRDLYLLFVGDGRWGQLTFGNVCATETENRRRNGDLHLTAPALFLALTQN